MSNRHYGGDLFLPLLHAAAEPSGQVAKYQMAIGSNSSGNGTILDLLDGEAGVGQNKEGIALKAFVLNIAVSLGLFAFEVSAFFLLKSSALGRRI